MIINRGIKLTVLSITLVLSVVLTSSLAMGAPHYLSDEINKSELAPQEQQVLDNEVGQEPENIEDDIVGSDGENAIQEEPLPLESIIIPPEPFMGAPVDVPAETKPSLPQTGGGLLYMEAGCLMTIMGIIINSKSRG